MCVLVDVLRILVVVVGCGFRVCCFLSSSIRSFRFLYIKTKELYLFQSFFRGFGCVWLCLCVCVPCDTQSSIKKGFSFFFSCYVVVVVVFYVCVRRVGDSGSPFPVQRCVCDGVVLISPLFSIR